MKPEITVRKSIVKILAFDCAALGHVIEAKIDLTPHAGERVRLWIERNGEYSTNPRQDHYWQIAELDVPAQEYVETAGDPDSEGRPTANRAAVPIDLSSVEIKAWSLPE